MLQKPTYQFQRIRLGSFWQDFRRKCWIQLPLIHIRGGNSAKSRWGTHCLNISRPTNKRHPNNRNVNGETDFADPIRNVTGDDLTRKYSQMATQLTALFNSIYSGYQIDELWSIPRGPQHSRVHLFSPSPKIWGERHRMITAQCASHADNQTYSRTLVRNLRRLLGFMALAMNTNVHGTGDMADSDERSWYFMPVSCLLQRVSTCSCDIPRCHHFPDSNDKPSVFYMSTAEQPTPLTDAAPSWFLQMVSALLSSHMGESLSYWMVRILATAASPGNSRSRWFTRFRSSQPIGFGSRVRISESSVSVVP